MEKKWSKPHERVLIERFYVRDCVHTAKISKKRLFLADLTCEKFFFYEFSAKIPGLSSGRD
jgi:hypothetical protein